MPWTVTLESSPRRTQPTRCHPRDAAVSWRIGYTAPMSAVEPRQLPLHATHQTGGARLDPVDSWLVPLDFGDVAAEYDALRHSAAILDLSMRGRLRLSGADRATFLHNMVTNDVVALRPGMGCNAAKLTLQGKIEGTMRVLCEADSLWCDIDPGAAAQVRASLERHRIMEDVAFHDATEEWALLAVQGPDAAAVLAAAGVDVGSLVQPLQHDQFMIRDVPVRIASVDHCGEGGFDLWAPAHLAANVWRALCAAGARAAGLRALDARRIEAGIPWFGSELTSEYFPMEAGLEAGWISYTKGCYLGQETISRLHHLGHVNRLLRGLVPEGDVAPPPGAELHAATKRIGTVTSVARSPALDRTIALGFVHREVADPGTLISAATASGPVVTRVVALPFV